MLRPYLREMSNPLIFENELPVKVRQESMIYANSNCSKDDDFLGHLSRRYHQWGINDHD